MSGLIRSQLPGKGCLWTISRLFANSCRHRYPGKPSEEATRALDSFQARFSASSQPTTHYVQTIDSNQIHLLRLTLAPMFPLRQDGRDEAVLTSGSVVQGGIAKGSPLLPAEHLVFFTPRVGRGQLGKDGSDASFNPPGGVFTRRMWAGGEMAFEQDNPLQIGDEAWEKTSVEEARWKELSGGRGEMIVVWVKKEIGNQKGLCLTDRRSWVFQPSLSAKELEMKNKTAEDSVSISSSPLPTTSSSPTTSTFNSVISPTVITQDAADLFRYSALTFNAHAIHLSPPWAQYVEGHPDIVVHGPLNLTLLLRKWGREKAGWTLDEDGNFVMHSKNPPNIRKVQYRSKKPVHAKHTYAVGFPKEKNESSGGKDAADAIIAVKEDGQTAMEASVTVW